MRTVLRGYKKITYPDADAPLFGKQLFVKVEPNYTNPESPVPVDGTDDEITVKVNDAVVGIYHSKWFGGVCYFYFDWRGFITLRQRFCDDDSRRRLRKYDD